MAYTLAPFNPSTPYQNQVATELNTANNNFTILGQAFYNNDPSSNPVLRASYIGSSAPSNPVAGMTWLDTSTNPPTLKVYDGSNWRSNIDTVDGFHASQTPTANTIPVANSSGKIDDGWLNFVANDPKVKTALNASGNPPIYACRAWVNFDGTQSTPTIRASGNVSSITKNGTGDYTVNFIVAMPNTNYADIGGGGKQADDTSTTGYTQVPYTLQSLKSTSAGRIRVCNPSNGTSADPSYVSYAVFI